MTKAEKQKIKRLQYIKYVTEAVTVRPGSKLLTPIEEIKGEANEKATFQCAKGHVFSLRINTIKLVAGSSNSSDNRFCRICGKDKIQDTLEKMNPRQKLGLEHPSSYRFFAHRCYVAGLIAEELPRRMERQYDYKSRKQYTTICEICKRKVLVSNPEITKYINDPDDYPICCSDIWRKRTPYLEDICYDFGIQFNKFKKSIEPSHFLNMLIEIATEAETETETE